MAFLCLPFFPLPDDTTVSHVRLCEQSAIHLSLGKQEAGMKNTGMNKI